MAARIDDFGVRQNEPDEADVQEIIGHLVDEERLFGLALNSRLLDVGVAEGAALLRTEGRRGLRDTPIPALARVGPPSFAAIAMMSCNSIVPSTLEWLARICSISVEPARGRPTMKIGSGAGAAEALAAREKLLVEQSLSTLHREVVVAGS